MIGLEWTEHVVYFQFSRLLLKLRYYESRKQLPLTRECSIDARISTSGSALSSQDRGQSRVPQLLISEKWLTA